MEAENMHLEKILQAMKLTHAEDTHRWMHRQQMLEGRIRELEKLLEVRIKELEKLLEGRIKELEKLQAQRENRRK